MKSFKFLLIDRSDFLNWRAKNTAKAKADGMPAHFKSMGFSDDAYFVMDAGDEIICDGCNADIKNKNIFIWIEGNRVECLGCLEKYFLNGEIE